MTTDVAEQKRRNDGFLDCDGNRPFSGRGCSSTSDKRLKSSDGSSPSVKEGKDRVGNRVAALQQLVSPFGKTDTASVLQEAADYINFLHGQLQVLSSPYLGSRKREERMINGSESGPEEASLRARGLCLVPLPCALRLARSNGADIWAPTKTTHKNS